MNTIEEVLSQLDQIIDNSKEDYDPIGYFTALYRGVTVKVQEGIHRNFFDDSARMEQLDVIFAQRYIDAYHAFFSNKELTHSWDSCFRYSGKYWPIVLQHLLAGMNAHINLDLGIAAALIGKDNMEDLKDDFNRINDVLAKQVNKVQHDLAEIWPTLKFLLNLVGRADNFLIDFSMQKARDGAWKFACELSDMTRDQQEGYIKLRDEKVTENMKIISNPGWVVSLIFKIIRLGEKGSERDKIECLLD